MFLDISAISNAQIDQFYQKHLELYPISGYQIENYLNRYFAGKISRSYVKDIIKAGLKNCEQTKENFIRVYKYAYLSFKKKIEFQFEYELFDYCGIKVVLK